MVRKKGLPDGWELWAVALLVIGIYIFAPNIFHPQSIYGEFPRVDGVYTDAFHEANPLTPKVCADNEIKFLKELPVVISVSKGKSRQSGCMCERDDPSGLIDNSCCVYYGYERQAWIPDICYGCVDYDIPEKVEIELNGEIIGTLTELDGSLAFDLAEHLNRINYDKIIYNIQTGDIEPYVNCVRIIATSSHNYGILHITDNPKPVYHDDPCDYKPYNDEYCKVWIDPEPEEIINETINETETDVNVPEKEEPEFEIPPGEDEVDETEPEEPEDKNLTIYLALIIVAILGYIVYKRQYK